MLLTLKEIRFDDGDEDRYVEIGGGRYLVYDEEDDYYIWDLPLPMRAKPIEVNPPCRGSIEEIRAFAIDRDHSVDFVLLGVLFRFKDGYVWAAGDILGDDAVEDYKKQKGLPLPPLVYRYPKEKPPNMSKNQLLAKIAKEAEIRMRDFMKRFGMLTPDELDLSIFINSDSGDEDEQVEAHNMEVEAHDMNQQPDTNTWTMEHLNSSLDDCATANCSPRGMPRINIWSMEQLNSSLGNCAMGKCPHCRGY